MKKWFSGVAAVLAVALAISVPARAAITINSGDVLGGWQITFPENVALFADQGVQGTINNNTLNLEKLANFTGPIREDFTIDPLEIVFTQVEEDAVPFITITNEAVINHNPLPWIGFDFYLVNDEGEGTGPTFLEGFNDIDPFTSVDFDDQLIQLRGGVVNVGETVFFGVGPDGGDLRIAAAPTAAGTLRTFRFGEQPIPIPLPPAAWMGLSGIAGVVLFRKRLSHAV